MRKLLVLSLIVSLSAGCSIQSGSSMAIPSETPAPMEETREAEEDAMKLYLNEKEIPVTWKDNPSVHALKEEAGNHAITVELSMYSDNEQVGPLGKTYPSRDAQITTEPGDIVLYQSDQIVVFYGSNTWAYTRLGKMNLSQEEVTDLLANGDVTLELSN